MRTLLKVIVAYIAVLPLAAQAQTALYKEINSRGRDVKIALTPETPSQIVLVVRSTDREAQSLDFSVSGPNGARVTIQSVMLSGASDNLEREARKGRPAKLKIVSNYAFKRELRIGAAAGRRPGRRAMATASETRDPSCGCLTEDEIESRMSAYRFTFPNITRAQMCAIIGAADPGSCDGSADNPPGTGDPGPTDPGAEPPVEGSGTVTGAAFVSYDKCNKTGQHAALISVNLAGVDAAALSGELVVNAKLREFGENKRASIKERGDGKYKVPLLLAGPVYGSFDPAIALVTFKGKARKTKALKVVDTVYYSPAGGALFRIPLSGGVLVGGVGTFEISNGAEGYSICAQLTARRQYFNGYHN